MYVFQMAATHCFIGMTGVDARRDVVVSWIIATESGTQHLAAVGNYSQQEGVADSLRRRRIAGEGSDSLR